MYQYLLTGVVMTVCSITDLKFHRVYKTAAASYFFLALLGHLIGRTMTPAAVAAGLLPGACCLLISWVSREGLGYGDSVLVACCGISTGLWFCLSMLTAAMFFAGLFAAVRLVFCRTGRGKEIPFVPFLLLGAAVQWAGGV